MYLGYVGLAASYIGGVLAPPQLMDFYLPISQMYQIPFYHMRVVLLGGWDTNNLEGCKLYGCGGLAFLICARTVQTDEGPALFLGEKTLR